MTVRALLPWALSAVTILATWLNERNQRLSWKVSLANQGGWLAFSVSTHAWGLLPLTLVLSCVFARHLWRSRPEPRWAPLDRDAAVYAPRTG